MQGHFCDASWNVPPRGLRRRVASDSEEERERLESWQRRPANTRAEERPSDLGWHVCSRLCRSQEKARVRTERT